MKKDERAYIAPHDTVSNAPLRDSLEPSPLPNANLPLHGARLHGLNLLLQIGRTICFMLAIIVQFTHGTIVDGVIRSWITDTSLKG